MDNMKTLSFYYPASEVMKACLSALRKKGYKILKLDPEKGLIESKSRFNLFKGSFNLNLQIEEINSYQTNLSLRSKLDHSWFFKEENIIDEIEYRFTKTLYHQISTGQGII